MLGRRGAHTIRGLLGVRGHAIRASALEAKLGHGVSQSAISRILRRGEGADAGGGEGGSQFVRESLRRCRGGFRCNAGFRKAVLRTASIADTTPRQMGEDWRLRMLG